MNVVKTAVEEPPPARISDGSPETEFVFREKPVYDFFKRAFDITVSLIALILLAVPLLIVMLIIWLGDGGNPIFVQERVGKDGKIFKILKLRTMIIDAEEHRDEVIDMDGVLYKPKNDPRVTKFGKFLRKTSLDEFVQFVNVLKGDMSIVGPRPIPTYDYEEVSKFIKRDVVKPGLSCYSVLDRHSRKSYENWVNLDLKYIRERSFPVDLKIILKTAGVVLLRKNY